MPFIAFIGSCYSDKPTQGQRVVKLIFDVNVENLVNHYVINGNPVFGEEGSSVVKIPRTFVYGTDIHSITGIPTGYPEGQMPYVGSISLTGNELTLTMSSEDTTVTV